MSNFDFSLFWQYPSRGQMLNGLLEEPWGFLRLCVGLRQSPRRLVAGCWSPKRGCSVVPNPHTLLCLQHEWENSESWLAIALWPQLMLQIQISRSIFYLSWSTFWSTCPCSHSLEFFPVCLLIFQGVFILAHLGAGVSLGMLPSFQSVVWFQESNSGCLYLFMAS